MRVTLARSGDDCGLVRGHISGLTKTYQSLLIARHSYYLSGDKYSWGHEHMYMPPILSRLSVAYGYITKQVRRDITGLLEYIWIKELGN